MAIIVLKQLIVKLFLLLLLTITLFVLLSTPKNGITSVKYQVIQVEDPLSFDPIGFNSGDATDVGSYTFQFNQAGTYHYWSGYVETSNQIIFRGIIEVVATADKHLKLDVNLNGYTAQKCTFPFAYMENNYTACTSEGESFSWCSPSPIYNGQKLKCDPIQAAPVASCPGSSVDAVTCNSQTIVPTDPYAMLFTSCTGKKKGAYLNAILRQLI